MAFAISAGAAAVIGAGAGLAGGIIQGNAASSAADKQSAAADRATQVQKGMYDQTRADQEPWRAAGAQALSGLSNPDFQRDFTQADFQKDPGYDFRMQQGQQALERSAAARGNVNSGGTMKALSRYGQDYASNEYGNAYNRFNADRDRRFNRLSSVAGVGQTANAQVGAAGQNYAGQAGSNMMGAASAQGAAGMAGAQGWANGLSGIANQANQGAWMSQFNKGQSNKPVISGGGSSNPADASYGWGGMGPG